MSVMASDWHVGAKERQQVTARGDRVAARDARGGPLSARGRAEGWGEALTVARRRAAPVVQAKLAVGPADDAFEREADGVADQVMRMPEPGVVQRMCGECEAEQEEQVQRQTVEPGEDEEGVELQMKPRPGRGATLGAAAAAGVRGLQQSGGSPLPASERRFFEPRFGQDFSAVRVHTGAGADTAARSMGARAFTLGHDVAFGAGQYTSGTQAGRKLLAHELTHVVQQGASHEAEGASEPVVRRAVVEARVQRQTADAPATPAQASPMTLADHDEEMKGRVNGLFYHVSDNRKILQRSLRRIERALRGPEAGPAPAEEVDPREGIRG
jgi:hypothetical protein